MARFVRQSNYRHVFGTGSKKEASYDNVKVSASAWDTNLISVNPRYLAVNCQVSGGGAFLVCPLSRCGKLPDLFPLARAHTAPVLDTDWNPFHEDIVASAGEDCKVQLTKIDADKLESAYLENHAIDDFKPLPLNMSHNRKAGHVLWHPTADNVLASASYDIKLWDVTQETAKIELIAHPDMVQSLAFDGRGTMLATTCKDKKLRLFDIRAGPDPVKAVDSHSGVKAARVCWLGSLDRMVTTGFSKLSDRQVFVWDVGRLDKPIKQLNVDASSAGTLMPFWSDNNILFLAGKGDGNIRYYEFEADDLFYLTEYKSSQPQRGMTFFPRRALNVSDHEIARAYKVTNNCIEPLTFTVPRKVLTGISRLEMQALRSGQSDSFQADIYPPALAGTAAMSPLEFFAGKTVDPLFVSLERGQSSSSPSTPQRSVTEPRVLSVAKKGMAADLSPEIGTRQTPERTLGKASDVESPALGYQGSIRSAGTFETASMPEFAATKPNLVFDPSVAIPNPSFFSDGVSNDTVSLRNELERLKAQLSERDHTIRQLEVEIEKMRNVKQRALNVLSE